MRRGRGWPRLNECPWVLLLLLLKVVVVLLIPLLQVFVKRKRATRRKPIGGPTKKCRGAHGASAATEVSLKLLGVAKAQFWCLHSISAVASGAIASATVGTIRKQFALFVYAAGCVLDCAEYGSCRSWRACSQIIVLVGSNVIFGGHCAVILYECRR